MPNWKSTVDIKDLHEAYRNKRISVQELSKSVGARFSTNKFIKEGMNNDFDLEDAIQYLIGGVDDIEDYDFCLNDIYNFCDSERIWVKTI